MTRGVAMRGWVGLLALAALAVALRAHDFGNPVIHIDEQFYLLVGDRMLHGAVPYIDIWDRKPIGLFLLYAGFRLLPGDGILAYQIGATLAAAATAWLIGRAAARLGASWLGVAAAGAAYLVWLEILGGRGGQSPVFYDVLMAGAGLLTLGLPHRAAASARGNIVLSGAAACALAGIAIQIKSTPVFEGIFFGIAHLVYLRRGRATWPQLAGATLLWAMLGAAPTLAVMAWYRAQGAAAFDAYWFANVISISLRPSDPLAEIVGRITGIAGLLSPFILGALISWKRCHRDGKTKHAATLMLWWIVAALIGFSAAGAFFIHYALPLTVPLTIAAAPALGRYRSLLIATFALGLGLFALQAWKRPDANAAGVYRVAAIVRANDRGQCPYIFTGDPIIYLLADACLPTDHPFPVMLIQRTETGATGIDQLGEVRRILDRRPPVIVATTQHIDRWNHKVLALYKARAARDYRVVATVRRANYLIVIHLRRDLPFRD